jgi:TolA-binding protein
MKASPKTATLLGCVLLLSACSGLGRELNQALPAFMRSDPGADEMAIFEKVRRPREWTEADRKDQQTRVEEIHILRRDKEFGSVDSKIKDFLELYPSSAHDEDLRFIRAEVFHEDDELKAAFRAYREFSSLYPLSNHGPTVVERIYHMGRSYLAGEQSTFFGIFSQEGSGIDMLEYLIETYPKSARAADSQYAIGRYRMEEGAWALAQADFRFLAEQYRESEWAPAAMFYDAYCFYRLVKGSVYDRKTMALAQRGFERYLAQVEDGEFAEQSRGLISELVELQAESLFRVGDWYAGYGKPYSSRYYFLSVLTRFPNSQAAVHARARLEVLKKEGVIGEPLEVPKDLIDQMPEDIEPELPPQGAGS